MLLTDARLPHDLAWLPRYHLTPVTSMYPIIGASAAICGVLGAYLLLFPRAKVLTLLLLPFFFTTLRVPAMLKRSEVRLFAS